jgi:V/A-type H+-transporting ATPase subunit K
MESGMNNVKREFKRRVITSIVAILTVMVISGTLFCNTVFAVEPAQDAEITKPAMTIEQADVMKFGLLAASIAFGLGAVGAGIAISHVGAAAMGAIAEKPQMAGQALIFVALAEGLVIFGFITALMILGKV